MQIRDWNFRELHVFQNLADFTFLSTLLQLLIFHRIILFGSFIVEIRLYFTIKFYD